MEIKYTQEEVLRNIDTFQKKEEDLINQRKDLNKTIQHVRKQKEYWEALDISQLKLL
jgi:uncharacterized protein YlxW (UPF0749 family)